MDQYQESCKQTAIYPHAGSGDEQELMYLALGLVGESGEIANKVKKIFRDGADYEYATMMVKRQQIIFELGDVLWYLCMLCNALGVDVEDVARSNLAKLMDRKERKVLGGDGDDR